MCGIVGIVGDGAGALSDERLRFSLDAVRHRGPDDEGIYRDEQAVLAMRRLSIIDLAGGRQPIHNEDGSLTVVCNGEIYNYVELFEQLEHRGHVLQSRSDVNAIPHLYEEQGSGCLEQLRGMFALALWDQRSRRLLLARDRAGKKPLYWSMAAGSIAFASELPALLPLLARRPRVSLAALGDFLRLGFVPHPRTIYEGVFALPPGSMLEFSPGGEPRLSRYWRMVAPRLYRGSREDMLEEADHRISEAVRLRLRSDVPLGLFLSGGIDSGLVASYAAEQGATNLRCFVLELSGDELDESDAATSVARHLGFEIERVPVHIDPASLVQSIPLLFGQPFGDESAIPTYLVSRAAALTRKVVLTGDGGDELFAGYRRYLPATLSPHVAALARRTAPLVAAAGSALGSNGRRRSPLAFASRVLRGLAVDPVRRYQIWTTDLLGDADLRRYFPVIASEAEPLDKLSECRETSFDTSSVEAFQLSDYRLILPDALLVKMDIASMANSVEARSPLLDIPLTDFAWSIPQEWRTRRGETKAVLRDLASRRLPAEVVRAPKRGFEIPVAKWLGSDLRELVGDVLLAGDSRVGALGDRRQLASLVAGLSGFEGNRAQTTWNLLVLELFLREQTPA